MPEFLKLWEGYGFALSQCPRINPQGKNVRLIASGNERRKYNEPLAMRSVRERVSRKDRDRAARSSELERIGFGGARLLSIFFAGSVSACPW